MRALSASDVEKVDYYFWGYYRPVYTFSTNPLAPRVHYPPGAYVYPPFWPYGYLPPFGYLDYYQTYGCLSPTRYCVFGQLPY